MLIDCQSPSACLIAKYNQMGKYNDSAGRFMPLHNSIIQNII